MGEIKEVVDQLFAKETKTGYKALRILEAKSEQSNEVYAYFDQFISLMRDENSYKRTRGLLLIAANAKWDEENKIEEIIEEYISHISDEKPITARQCIKAIPKITKAKPKLKETVQTALHQADVKKYGDSMWHLVYEDVVGALQEIERQ